MKEFVKRILKNLHIYHPLQSFYRNIIDLTKKILYRLIYRKYKGKGFTCNFCGARYEKFVPEYPTPNIASALMENEVVAGYGENVFCPNCLSKNRERLLLAVFKNIYTVEGKNILHFSPEKNLYAYLNEKANITTVDLMPGFYRNIDTSVGFADATNLSFKDEVFDMAIANHVLEHIPEDRNAISEINRILKKGGLAVLQVPYSEKLVTTIEDPYINDPDLQERLYGQKDHVRIYSLKDYLERLRMGGFQTEVLSPEFLHQFTVYAIQEKECVILAHKP